MNYGYGGKFQIFSFTHRWKFIFVFSPWHPPDDWKKKKSLLMSFHVFIGVLRKKGTFMAEKLLKKIEKQIEKHMRILSLPFRLERRRISFAKFVNIFCPFSAVEHRPDNLIWKRHELLFYDLDMEFLWFFFTLLGSESFLCFYYIFDDKLTSSDGKIYDIAKVTSLILAYLAIAKIFNFFNNF